MRNTKILFIEDDLDFKNDPLILEIKEEFEDVLFFDNPNEAISFIKSNLVSKIIIMLDLAFPPNQPNGHKILNSIREFSFLIPIIIFSGKDEETEPFGDLINNKAFAFLKKSSSSHEIVSKLIEADEYLNSDVAAALEDWINCQTDDEKNKPFLKSIAGEVLSLNDILLSIRQQTETGKAFSKNLLKLTIDLLSRNKEQLND